MTARRLAALPMLGILNGVTCRGRPRRSASAILVSGRDECPVYWSTVLCRSMHSKDDGVDGGTRKARFSLIDSPRGTVAAASSIANGTNEWPPLCARMERYEYSPTWGKGGRKTVSMAETARHLHLHPLELGAVVGEKTLVIEGKVFMSSFRNPISRNTPPPLNSDDEGMADILYVRCSPYRRR